jgi:photosystem II stability/assembly factor-like uncharacterized protein
MITLSPQSDEKHGSLYRLALRGLFGLLILSMISMPLNAQNKDKKPAATVKPVTVVKTVKPEKIKNQADTTAKSKDTTKIPTVTGLKFRNIGPAFTSGRIADFAVNPNNKSEYYVAVASGNVWKTVNNGTTFTPIFDSYGAYSIGCIEIDPNNSNTVWCGTGEHNHQRALGYGDGIYKSTDAGKTWKNMGLKDSRQIGGIVIDPRNSDVVYVAAEGSVWGPGGDRGLYKTTDGGKTWKKIQTISENTGINNIIMDPRNPDVLYSTSEQRRRHVFTKIGGGPESAVWKSTNAGETWVKIMKGMATGDIGGMGMAISPVNPDVLYIIAEAKKGQSGFYRSQDRGATWQKMSDYSSQGQYFNTVICDPKNVDKVYSLEVVSKYSEDGGATWKPIGNNHRHVDDHAMWIDPSDTKHFMIGGDGGAYESFDGGKEFIFKSNIPVAQFYRVSADNSFPFYYVYGGTQDNNSVGGPSRTTNGAGTPSDDWMVTNGGDGFWSQVDPTNPNIIYAESQYGGMVRYDRKSQESMDIRPEPRKGELTYRWNWNTPLIMSPFSNTRIYTAANKVFKSDDRGNSWQVISEDLTAQIDRNKWPVMGKFWPADAVGKDVSTSLYGEIVALDESPVKENLLYAGTDDGLIQMTDDGGKNWHKTTQFPGVPENTYVSDVFASRFDQNVVFASFDNILRDDFKPYIFKSTDKGTTWTSIAANLPANGTVHCIQQDFVNPDLLFVGTEFGVFYTNDGGKVWNQIKEGIPTICIKDMTIQKRESDLIVASFGRGYFVMDDYSPLREVNKSFLEKEGHLFNVKDALMYLPTDVKGSMGSTPYLAPNPDFGATFTYFVKDTKFKLKKDLRKEVEDSLFKKSLPMPMPTDAQLIDEEKELSPYLTFTITDEAGNVVRKIKTEAAKGVKRINWDLRLEMPGNVQPADKKVNTLAGGQGGPFALPGTYKVSLALTTAGNTKEVAGPVSFKVVPLNNETLPAENKAEMNDFYKKAIALSRKMREAQAYGEELQKRVNYARQAFAQFEQSAELQKKAQVLADELDDLMLKFTGRTKGASDEETPPMAVPLNWRIGGLAYSYRQSQSAPTQTMQTNYRIVTEEFPPILDRFRQIGTLDLKALEDAMDKANIPYTPGRIPLGN